MSSLRPLRSRLPAAHQAKFSQFAGDLQQAVRQYVPTDLGRYQRAAIFAFDWNNDTMGVKGLRDELLGLLKRVYGFQTETHVMNARDPSATVDLDFYDAVLRFVQKNRPKPGEKNLLVYYYSGHSDSGPQQNELRLGGRINQNGDLQLPHLNWYQASHVALQVPGCETLLLMDSCNSAMAAIRPEGEILTASGWESVTSANLASSFTRFVIDELTALNGRAIAVCDLHAKLMDNALRTNMSATPIHKSNFNYPSVVIHKIGSREAQDLNRVPRTTAAKVLITVSISFNDLPNINEWKNWLTSNMPTDINNIEIVAHWNSASRTVLVSLPIQVWDYLRENPAYSFVSFMQGEVEVFRPSTPQYPVITTQSQSALTPKGKENVRPSGSGRNVGPPPPPSPIAPHMMALRPRPSSQNPPQSPAPGSSGRR